MSVLMVSTMILMLMLVIILMVFAIMSRCLLFFIISQY